MVKSNKKAGPAFDWACASFGSGLVTAMSEGPNPHYRRRVLPQYCCQENLSCNCEGDAAVSRARRMPRNYRMIKKSSTSERMGVKCLPRKNRDGENACKSKISRAFLQTENSLSYYRSESGLSEKRG
jgi:hypothetical protein